MDVNKGGGVDQNKRGLLAEESEALWVIKGRTDEGACVVRSPGQHHKLSTGYKATVV